MKGTTVGDIPMHLEYGDFGDADPKISETTGLSFYNLRIRYTIHEQEQNELCVITEEGLKMATKSLMGIAVLKWMTEEEAGGRCIRGGGRSH